MRPSDGSQYRRARFFETGCRRFGSGYRYGGFFGPEMLRTYEGLLPAADGPGIRYELTLENREHSGDGTYRLAMTYLEAENGRDTTFFSSGRWGTLRGTDDDPDATVYQLNIGDTTLEQINFLSYPDSLIMLGADMKRAESKLNYTLKLVWSVER